MAKYKLTKTVVSKSNKTETTTPKIKRFTKEQAKKWVARRKAKLGSGVFRNYGTKESSELSLSANPPAVVVWEFEKVANTAPERKKHSVKHSALKEKETVRRKKPEVKKEGKSKIYQIERTTYLNGKKEILNSRLLTPKFDSIFKARKGLNSIANEWLGKYNYEIARESENSISIEKPNDNYVKKYRIVEPDKNGKHTVKKSALKKKETVRRSKESSVNRILREGDRIFTKLGEVKDLTKEELKKKYSVLDAQILVATAKKWDKKFRNLVDSLETGIHKIYIPKELNPSQVWYRYARKGTATRLLIEEPEAKPKDEIKRFEVGKTYSKEVYSDGYSITDSITVIKRTAKTLTFTCCYYHSPKTCKIHIWDNVEGIDTRYIRMRATDKGRIGSTNANN